MHVRKEILDSEERLLSLSRDPAIVLVTICL